MVHVGLPAAPRLDAPFFGDDVAELDVRAAVEAEVGLAVRLAGPVGVGGDVGVEVGEVLGLAGEGNSSAEGAMVEEGDGGWFGWL